MRCETRRGSGRRSGSIRSDAGRDLPARQGTPTDLGRSAVATHKHHIYLRASSDSRTSGRTTYFGHVRRVLTERLIAAGLEPHIHIVKTSPTASPPARTVRVAEVIAALLWMGSLLVRFGGLVANSDLLDELFGRLPEDFTPARRRAVRNLWRDVVRDQALMLQLTPEAMEVFNASVLERPGIRYGAVVAQAGRPSLLSALRGHDLDLPEEGEQEEGTKLR
jgi:hypothetical protein